MLANLSHPPGLSQLLVGHENADDAAALQLDGERVLVQTVDFFTPIVDDPETFGAIAAANSISDIYAMGAEPILGLAVAMFPSDVLPLSVLEAILRGGVAKASEAGFPVAGGHTIIDDTPKYGLAVTGIVSPERLVRNSTARPGDSLFLTKPIGSGILVAAYRAHGASLLRRFRRSAPSLEEAIHWMLMLNRDASERMVAAGASAATDVTGYGLVGHLLEMCVGSGTGAEIDSGAVPVLSGARDLLSRGHRPEGSRRNALSFTASVELEVSELEYQLLCDAQTSGGLLISISEDRERSLVDLFERDGLLLAKIGKMNDRAGIVRLV
jgi:selenide, water dikinase